jgi:hypothetical protein
MYLDDVRVHIPSHLLKESNMVLNILLSMSDSPSTREFTLAAPTEWLQSWVACYVQKVEHLGDADTEVLVNCLKVCLCSRIAASDTENGSSSSNAVTRTQMPRLALLGHSTPARQQSPGIRQDFLSLTDFLLQAADFLAVESHIEEVSSALTEQLFTAGLRHHKTESQVVPEEVLFFVCATCCGFMVGAYTV